MDLYLLRHATAQDAREPGVGSDFDRRLTDEGREEAAAVAATLQALGVSFTTVWSSPLPRARETAAIAAPQPAAELREELANEPPERVIAALRGLDADASVLLVGHEPQMGLLALHLLGGQAHVGGVRMRKAGLAHLRFDPRRWPGDPAELRMVLPPKAAARLSQA